MFFIKNICIFALKILINKIIKTMEKRIQTDLVSAMKSKDSIRLASIRAIKTAITVAKTAPGASSDLNDADIQKIIQKLVKQRKDSAEQYIAAGRQELADNELAEMEIMNEYLPKQLTEDEIKTEVMNAINELNATSMKDMGKVMGFINKKFAGQVDGKVVSIIVKNSLS